MNNYSRLLDPEIAVARIVVSETFVLLSLIFLLLWIPLSVRGVLAPSARVDILELQPCLHGIAYTHPPSPLLTVLAKSACPCGHYVLPSDSIWSITRLASTATASHLVV